MHSSSNSTPRASLLTLACLLGAAPGEVLAQAASDANSVVVTGTRSERQLSQVPVRTEVLRQEDMQLRAVADLSQAAELINGLRVESNCQNCNTSEVQLLGLPGAYNQILFDGIPLMSTLGSVYGLEQVPSAFVERIEVVKGGGSSLYGPGAVAGVVNLIVRRPSQSGGQVRASQDNYRGTPMRNVDARVDATGLNGRLALSVLAQRSRNDGIDVNGDGYTEIARKDLKVGGLQAWFNPGPDTVLHADFQYTDEARRGGNLLDRPEHLTNIAESLRTRYQRGSLSWQQILDERSDLRIAYAFADIARNSFYGGLGEIETDPSAPGYDPSQLDPAVDGSAASTSYRQYGRTTNPLHYLDAQYNLRRGEHALAMGAQIKEESLRDVGRDATGRELVTLADDTFRNLGVFVQDEWALDQDTDLVLGVRADKSSELDSVVWSPRVALAWQATPAVKWRAALSSGFRAPEAFSEDVHVENLGGEPVRIRNADGLAEERAYTAMLGVAWRSSPQQPVWQWDATASFTRLQDTFVLGEIETGADGSLYRTRGNADSSRVAGLETNLDFRPSREWRANVGLAWYESRYDSAQVVYDDSGDGGDTVLASRRYQKTPRLTGLAQLTWEPTPDWQFFAATRYTGSMEIVNNNRAQLVETPRFWVVDLGGMYHLHWGLDGARETTLSFGVRNLDDRRQRDLEVGAGRDSTYVYGPRFGRSWYLSLQQAF